jgi:hypothetical protein
MFCLKRIQGHLDKLKYEQWLNLNKVLLHLYFKLKVKFYEYYFKIFLVPFKKFLNLFKEFKLKNFPIFLLLKWSYLYSILINYFFPALLNKAKIYLSLIILGNFKENSSPFQI